MPVLSVVIPTFNAARFLPAAIESALHNSPAIGDVEVIVVDDGSTDETAAVLEGYRDRICAHVLPHCGMPSKVRNYGLERASAEVIAFLDADDECLPGRFERGLQLLDHSGAGLAFCDWKLDDGSGSLQPTFFEKTGALSFLRHALCEGAIEDCFGLLIRHGSFIGGGSMMIRKAAIQQVGLFDATLRIGEDYELATRLASAFRVAVDFTPGILRRVHGGNLSQDWAKRWPDELALDLLLLERPAVCSRPELHKALRRRTAQVCRGLGSWHLSQGDVLRARRYWRQGMALEPFSASTLFTVLSFLPVASLRWLQTWKAQ